MSDEIETIDKNPKSWVAWKREAERLQGIIDGMALAAMDSDPVATLDVQSGRPDGNKFALAYSSAAHKLPDDIYYLYRHAQPAPDREQVRREHAEWSQTTFGNVGPVGPLKHLSKEALEAAAEPDDLSEWADMQFLLWDAQRRAGITDDQITQAMIEKLAVNKQREWPAPKDGEPRLHIKEQSAPLIPSELHPDTQKLVTDFCSALAEKLYKSQLKYGHSDNWSYANWEIECQTAFHEHIAKGDPRDVAAYCAFMWYHGWKTEAAQPAPVMPDTWPRKLIWSHHDDISQAEVLAWNNAIDACRAAMLNGGKS